MWDMKFKLQNILNVNVSSLMISKEMPVMSNEISFPSRSPNRMKTSEKTDQGKIFRHRQSQNLLTTREYSSSYSKHVSFSLSVFL